MSIGVCHCAEAITPEHIRNRHSRCGSCFYGSVKPGVRILDVEVERDRGAAKRLRRASAHIGEFVVYENEAVTDLHYRMNDFAAVGRRSDTQHFGSERGLVKF